METTPKIDQIFCRSEPVINHRIDKVGIRINESEIPTQNNLDRKDVKPMRPEFKSTKNLRNRIANMVDSSLIAGLVDQHTIELDKRLEYYREILLVDDKKMIRRFKLDELQYIRDRVKDLIEINNRLVMGKSGDADEKISQVRELMNWIYFFNTPTNQKLFNGNLSKDIDRLEKNKTRKELANKYKHKIINAAQNITKSKIFEEKKQTQLVKVKRLDNEINVMKLVEDIRDYVQYNNDLPRIYFVERMSEYCHLYMINPETISDRVINQYLYSEKGYNEKIRQIYETEKQKIDCHNRDWKEDEIVEQLGWLYAAEVKKIIYHQVNDKFGWKERFVDIFPWEITC